MITVQSTHDWYLPDSARVVDGLAQTAWIIVHNSRCGRAQRHALKPSLASVLPKHIAVALKSRGRGRGLGGGGWTASAWSSALGRSACRCKWPSLVAACLHTADHYASETNTVSSQHTHHTPQASCKTRSSTRNCNVAMSVYAPEPGGELHWHPLLAEYVALHVPWEVKQKVDQLTCISTEKEQSRKRR